nr:uncharacterized protein LOC112210242 [Halyomorpha halys]
MSFQKGKKSRLPQRFVVNGEGWNISNIILYLGVTHDRHLTLSSHARGRLKLARQKSHRLYHLLTSQQISLRLKLQIYKAIIRPTLLYGAPLMRHLYKTTLTKLQSFQNSLLRRSIRGTSLQRARNREICEELQLSTVPKFIGRRHI